MSATSRSTFKNVTASSVCTRLPTRKRVHVFPERGYEVRNTSSGKIVMSRSMRSRRINTSFTRDRCFRPLLISMHFLLARVSLHFLLAHDCVFFAHSRVLPLSVLFLEPAQKFLLAREHVFCLVAQRANNLVA